MLSTWIKGLQSFFIPNHRTTVPILFVIGPSGAGKTALSHQVESELGFLHIDIDQRHGPEVYGLHEVWDRFINDFDIVAVAAAIRAQMTGRHAGVVLSLPSGRVLTRRHINTAVSAGIVTVLLWGNEELCRAARRAREQLAGRELNEQQYEEKNRPAYNCYATAEYDDVRICTFFQDGLRVPIESLLNDVRQRLAYECTEQQFTVSAEAGVS